MVAYTLQRCSTEIDHCWRVLNVAFGVVSAPPGVGWILWLRIEPHEELELNWSQCDSELVTAL